MCVYTQHRSLVAAAARYTEQGKYELAKATIDMVAKLPPQIGSAIYFIRFQDREGTYYLIQFSTSSPNEPFDLVEAKALADGHLFEFRPGLLGQNTKKSERGTFYNYEHAAVTSQDILRSMASAQRLQFKFYSSDGRSFIQELDSQDLQYARFLMDYLERN